MRPKDMPNGLTQKQSGRSGSRAVRWPATPSLKPKRSNSRKAAAMRCLMWVRSSSGDENVGNECGRVGLTVASEQVAAPSLRLGRRGRPAPPRGRPRAA